MQVIPDSAKAPFPPESSSLEVASFGAFPARKLIIMLLATEALEKSKTSAAAFIEAINDAEKEIIKQCENGERHAWVDLPHEVLKERFFQELSLAGYTLGNRQGFKFHISW